MKCCRWRAVLAAGALTLQVCYALLCCVVLCCAMLPYAVLLCDVHAVLNVHCLGYEGMSGVFVYPREMAGQIMC